MILLVSGSTNTESTNRRLLEAVAAHFDSFRFDLAVDLGLLPMFRIAEDRNPYPDIVNKWKDQIAQSKAVMISTPAYLQNIPAALKNALEWLKSSGEIAHKPVIVMTYTPHQPRGQEALQSLIWSLQALEARIEAKCQFYQTDLVVDVDGKLRGEESIEVLGEAMKMLIA